MSKRQQLLDRIDELTREFGPYCPFATSVLHSLMGAMFTDIDRELAAVSLAFMKEQLCITAEMIEEVRQSKRPVVSPSDN